MLSKQAGKLSFLVLVFVIGLLAIHATVLVQQLKIKQSFLILWFY
jgi:hypothetical protein